MAEFHFLGLSIKTFSALLALGSAFGLWQTKRSIRPSLAVPVINTALAALAASLLGARAVYVAVHWAYFRGQPLEGLILWQGGLAWAGALGGGYLGLLIASRWQHQSFPASADHLLPLLFSLSLAIWLGCWVEGVAYGQLSQAWWALPGRDEWGQVSLRFPLQFGGTLASLALYWISPWLQQRFARRWPGLAASLGLAGLSLLMLLASLLRADPAPVWYGLRLDTLAAVGFLLLAGMGMGILWMQKKRIVQLET